MQGVAATRLELLPGMATGTFFRLRLQARLQCGLDSGRTDGLVGFTIIVADLRSGDEDSSSQRKVPLHHE